MMYIVFHNVTTWKPFNASPMRGDELCLSFLALHVQVIPCYYYVLFLILMISFLKHRIKY